MADQVYNKLPQRRITTSITSADPIRSNAPFATATGRGAPDGGHSVEKDLDLLRLTVNMAALPPIPPQYQITSIASADGWRVKLKGPTAGEFPLVCWAAIQGPQSSRVVGLAFVAGAISVVEDLSQFDQYVEPEPQRVAAGSAVG